MSNLRSGHNSPPANQDLIEWGKDGQTALLRQPPLVCFPLKILGRADHPVLVMAEGGVFKKHYKYLTSYKGLFFYTKSDTVLPQGNVELITAGKIWIPG